MSNDKTFSLNLSEFGSLLASTSGFLAVGGYVSLRSYLNRMEIPGPAFLGAERYLLEAYLFADGLFLILPLAATLVLILLVWRAVAPSNHRATLRFAGAMSTRVRPAIALATVGLLWWLLRQSFLGAGLWPAAGFTRPAELQTRHPELFLLAIAVALMWWFTAAASSRESSEFGGLFGNVLRESAARTLTAAISLALALALPVLYGRERRPDQVPLVQVTFQEKNTPPLCGLAVLHWSDGLLVWHAKGRQPRLELIRLERVAYVSYGATRSLGVAYQGAYGFATSVPDCTAELG